VALLTGLREASGDVIRVRRGLKIFQVAGDAGGAGQVVVVVDVAVETDTRRIGMCIGQREAHRVVVKSRRLPGARGVAHLTVLREASGDVIRIGRGLKILQVAGDTSRAGQVVVVVDVAVEADTRRIGVRIGQREANRVVVKGRRLPSARGVALLTILREASGDVIRIGRGLKILQVAGDAGGAGQTVVVVDVAIEADTRRVSVRIGQREAKAGVIELSVRPSICTVALLATD